MGVGGGTLENRFKLILAKVMGIEREDRLPQYYQNINQWIELIV